MSELTHMPDDLRLFETYRDPFEAQNVAAVLQKAGITFVLEDETGQLHNLAYPLDVLNAQYKLRMGAADFARAKTTLEHWYISQIKTTPADYMLFAFTDEELIDVILKADEWGVFNTVLARHILEQRGVPVHPAFVAGLQKKRIAELSKPVSPDHYIVVLGYFSAFMGGLFGIFIGWYILSGKKTLPDGVRVYTFTPTDRKHGRAIVITGCVMFVAWIVFRVWAQG